ncbi:ABC transporter ATP-binding protein [Pseudoduganella plicata]|uniref:ABC transporter ATP-binding protein n=1 Tax=Pseudoduganella plicata TaxID=321984 RepID=A0A4P7BBC9_9BURK|nr:ABC transporter ATP-binding protein [Pseudoduganella plicata]QBQ35774.1 ABC transporter ATP-binding protein [Pseudoduganella plicata]GGY95158.1 ABC transporter ATP-binding protein [Pseudoduganella plicata]
MVEVDALRAGYGAINVLWDVSMQFAEGRLTTIIGPNGAGKTTLLRALMGLVPVGAGAIRLAGRNIAGTPTWRMADAGIAMVPEGRMIFRDMTVEENLIMGAFARAHRPHVKERLASSYEMFPRLAERRRQLAGSLSGGEAQMVAMARALMADPRILVVDEPSLGLAPIVVAELFGILARLKAEGRTIVLVEQNTAQAVGVADHVYLMQGGRVVLSQAATDVRLEELHALYFAR